MTVEFPNMSRSFEAAKNRIRFWGYDRTIEITFFVEVEALAKIFPEVHLSETAALGAFDTAIEKIHQIARKTHSHSRGQTFVHVLTTRDF